MTSATAGKPTVAPLTTPDDRTLRTRGCPINICVGRTRARQPTKNSADSRQTKAVWNEQEHKKPLWDERLEKGDERAFNNVSHCSSFDYIDIYFRYSRLGYY